MRQRKTSRRRMSRRSNPVTGQPCAFPLIMVYGPVQAWRPRLLGFASTDDAVQWFEQYGGREEEGIWHVLELLTEGGTFEYRFHGHIQMFRTSYGTSVEFGLTGDETNANWRGEW